MTLRTERNDTIKIAQKQLLDTILDGLKQDKIPWIKPWKAKKYIPVNAVTNKTYTNTNLFTLLIHQYVKGYEDPRWMTFKQAQDKGWRIKRGSTSVHLYFSQWWNTETDRAFSKKDLEGLSNEEKQAMRSKLILRSKAFKVFNAEQIDGIPPLAMSDVHIKPFENEMAGEFCSNLIESMDISLQEGGNRAYYAPGEDKIVLPTKSAFQTEQHYYGTLIHELGHATGHASRLSRDLSGSFGSKEYALEELRAEMNSALMAIDVGFELSEEHVENHKAYCQSWYDVLKDDPSVLFKAIHDAHRMREYMLEQGRYDAIVERELVAIGNNAQIPKRIDEDQSIAYEQEGMHPDLTLADRLSSFPELVQIEAQEILSVLLENRMTQDEFGNANILRLQRQLLEVTTLGSRLYIQDELDRIKAKLSPIEWAQLKQRSVTEISDVLVQNITSEAIAPNVNQTADEKHPEPLKSKPQTEQSVQQTKEVLKNVTVYELMTADKNIQKVLVESGLKTTKDINQASLILHDGTLIDGNYVDEVPSLTADTISNVLKNEWMKSVEGLDVKTNALLSLGAIQIIPKSGSALYMRGQPITALQDAILKRHRFEQVPVGSIPDTLKVKQVIKVDEKADEKEMLKEQVSIIDFAENVLGLNSVSMSGGLVSLVEHDSCIIYPNNSYYRWSSAKGGDIYNFVMEFADVDFAQALKMVKEYYGESGPTSRTFSESRKEQGSSIVLPTRNATTKNVFAYLSKTRCVSPKVINEYLKRGLVYQEEGNNNCVFVGKLFNSILYATKRASSSSKSFKQEVEGSYTEVGVHFGNESDTLVVTESVIDQMSYMTMEEAPEKFDYLSINGVANVIGCLNFHLIKRDENNKIKNIVLALDNDTAGMDATLEAAEWLKQNYPGINQFTVVPKTNDWNQDLESLVKGIDLSQDIALVNQTNEVSEIVER